MTYTVLCGDVSEVLPTLAPESFDAVLCDPPYGLSFMGKHWDHGVPARDVWKAVARTLKPGAHLLAFGGTRTFHRLAVAIEDAGFEIRDCLSWLYATGFPKSLDISKAIDKAAGAERKVVGSKVGLPGYSLAPDKGRNVSCVASGNSASECAITAPATDAARLWHGYGTALKPAWEPCILAMKPLDGTFAENALRHGVAGLNVDGGRIATSDNLNGGAYSGGNKDPANATSFSTGVHAGTFVPPLGRWPANLILDEGSARLLDEMSGERRSAYPGRQDLAAAYAGSPVPLNGVTNFGGSVAGMSRSDTGGASRFFFRVPNNALSLLFDGIISAWIDAIAKSAEPSLFPQSQPVDSAQTAVAPRQPQEGAGRSESSDPYADRVEGLLRTLLETIGDSAQESARVERVAQIARAARCAGSPSDLCGIVTALSLAQFEPDLSRASLLGRDSINALRRQILSLCRALVDEWGSIDTILTTQSQNWLSGCVPDATGDTTTSGSGDPNSASARLRFRYQSKASRREREAGLQGFEEREAQRYGEQGQGPLPQQTPRVHKPARNHHPTVKPLALCEYLARLILPPKRDTPRRLLVPFSGSGSEMIGALLAGWDEVVGIEREAEYVAIAEARLRHWTDGAQLELTA